jgi:S1-C subfamily serine protease
MRRITILLLLLLSFAGTLCSAPARFILDDDEYLDQVNLASTKLLEHHKLIPIETLRAQVQTRGHALKLTQPVSQKLTPPEIFDRLRQSTLAIGSFYKCPECGEWHFNSSAGFVVSSAGVVCTCCHVIMAEDEGVKEAYLVAADSNGHVFPVESVLAADTDADTCFVKIAALGLKPLPFRSDVRVGERVYCLSHPGGFHFMFTEGIVSRLNRRRDLPFDEHGKTNDVPTRPILYLNVTAEFAPGSSGAAMVDEAGNVVGQVCSIAESGEPAAGDDNTAPSPSVPIRFCVAAEEIQGLTNPHLKAAPVAARAKPVFHHFSRVPTNQPSKVPSAK